MSRGASPGQSEQTNERAIHGCRMALIVSRFSMGRATHLEEVRGRLLLVGGDGAGFVVVDIENGVELSELKDVLDLFGQVEEL